MIRLDNLFIAYYLNSYINS